MAVWSLPFDRGPLLGVEPAGAARRVGSPRLALPVDGSIVLSPVVCIDEASIACVPPLLPLMKVRTGRLAAVTLLSDGSVGMR